MEKVIITFRRWFFLLSLFIGFGISSAAVRVKIDGLYYELNGSNATVTYENTESNNYASLPVNLIIPATVEYGGSIYTVTTISDQAFANCSKLESISIPGTVTRIGMLRSYDSNQSYYGDYYGKAGEALPFYNCRNLKSVRFEDGITTLNLGSAYSTYAECSKGLFYYCPLEEIYLGRNVSYLYYSSYSFSKKPSYYGYSVFYNKNDLKKVTIGDKVTSLPEYLFFDCSALEFVDFGERLTGIPENAFKNCSSLTSAMLPESVKEIGASAFSGCTSLKTVSAPGVNTIGDGAFDGNSSLSALELSSTFTSLGNQAFYGTRSLASISLPNTLKSIGVNAFYGSGIKEIKIPESVTTIGAYCFESSQIEAAYFGYNNISMGSSVFANCGKLTSVTIAGGQETIPESCFSGCSNLQQVSLSNGLLTISDRAFANCSKLESISIPGTVTRIGTLRSYDSNQSYYGDYYGKAGEALPFYNCTRLKSVRFEDGITTLNLGSAYSTYAGCSKGLFYYCPLEEIYLGRNVSYLYYSSYSFSKKPSYYGYSAFYNKNDLKKVTIGGKVTSLPQYLFSGCSNIESIIAIGTTPPTVGTNGFANYNATLYYSGAQYATASPWSGFGNKYAMSSDGGLLFIPMSDTEAMVTKFPGYSHETITFPTTILSNGKNLTVTKVMEGAFAACPDLTLVEFPETLTEIGEGAFARNDKLASLSFNGQKIIGKGAFSGCKSITSLVLPNSLEEIRERAFYENTAITSISFGNGLQTIGKEAFASCSSLTAARIPDAVETIGSSAFEDCVKLTYVSLGNGLKDLGSRGFFNCKVLTEVEIPGTTKTVGDQAFENCVNLTMATLNPGIETIGANCFKGCENLVTISIPGTVTTIGEGSFDDCSMLSSVSFLAGEEDLWIPYFTDCPVKTLRIGRNLKYSYGEAGSPFRNKSSINRVSFTGNYLTNIYNNLFDGCTGIKTIALPSSLQTINSYAFHRCTGLTMIEVPEGVTAIGNNAFENCTSLAEVSLPSTLAEIEAYLFHNDVSLAEIELKEGLETIRTHAFDNCETLGGLQIPGSTKLIEDFTFKSCKALSNLTFSDSNEAITLAATRSMFRDCPLESMYVGRNINYDYSVKENVPFYNSGKLTSVTFSDGEQLTTILPYFLYSAKTLPSVVLPDNIQEVGKYAFAECGMMESIQLSNSIKSIEEGLLKDCSALQSLIIPASVLTVNNYALGGCASLADLHIADSQDPMKVNIAASGKGMCAETGLVNLYVGRDIDYTATSNSGYSPFYGLGTLKSCRFTAAGYVTKLDDYYLYNCSAVENLDLPESLKTIGHRGCAGMTQLQSCRMRNNVTSVAQYGFAYDENLTDLTFSTGVTTLKNNLFDGCLLLPRFTVHPAVTTIEDNVFNSCNSLKNLSFTANGEILKMGRKYVDNTYSSLFADCPVESLYLSRWLIYEIGDESWSPFYSQTNLKDLTFGETLGDVGKFLFEKCSALETVDIPGVESIGEKAFYQCSQLNDLTFNSGTRSLGEYAFAECMNLDNITLPSTVVSISDGCFMNCTALNTLDMGNSLEIIGPSAFSGCSSLVNADIPATVYGLGVESFKGCVSLPYINIPNGINSVGARAFQGCNSAEWLTLSAKVTSLGANSFDGCSSIRYIKSFNEIPPVGLPAFVNSVVENATVFVPTTALDDYKDADIWWEFFDIRSMSDQNFVTYLTLDKSETSLKADETVQLTALAGPEDATDTSIGFVSDNVDVATVDNTGLVTAVAVGEANVKAYAKDGSGYYQICKVTVVPTLMESLELSHTSMTMRVNRRASLSAEVYPASTTNKEVIWSSSNKTIAEVDDEGNIITKYKGTATIKAMAADGSGVLASCELTVLPPMAGDSNDNDAVTVTDAVNTANYAVGNDVENFCFEAADVNEDTRITLADASATISIILDEQAPNLLAKTKSVKGMEPEMRDYLVVDDYNVENATTEISIYLDNAVEYVALQGDIILPEGMNIEAVSCGDRIAEHSLLTRRIDNRTLRFVLFDPENSVFPDNNEAILVLKVKIDEKCMDGIVIDNILGSDKMAGEYLLHAKGGAGISGSNVNELRKTSGWINTDESSVRFYNYVGEEVSVYSSDGMLMSRFTVASDGESHCFETGVYLISVNGDTYKVVVK